MSGAYSDTQQYRSERAAKFAHLDYTPTRVPGHAVWYSPNSGTIARCSCGFSALCGGPRYARLSIARHLESAARRVGIA